MEWKGPVKPTFFDIPEDLKDEMKVEAAKRRITLRAAVQEAFEAWLKPDKGSRSHDPEEFQQLRKVLDSGNDLIIGAVRTTLRLCMGNMGRAPKKKAG